MKSLIIFTILCFCVQAKAIEPVRIDLDKSYDKYTNEELRRRVWQLERAVAQLQDQVLQLAAHQGTASVITPATWTCQMQSFAKTLVASGTTRASALAQVLKKCSDATNAVHCHEANVNCDNQ